MQLGSPTKETSYCPDYINRKKEEKMSGSTLKEWLEHKEKEANNGD